MADQHVAVYLRISMQDRRGNVPTTSIEKQRNSTRSVAAARYPDRRVVEYVDDGVSASSASKRRLRAGLDSMLAAIRRGDVRGVVVDTLDRVDRGRGAAALWELAEACELTGTDLVGASQEIDLTTSSGELNASVMAAAARYEARRTADRVKATNRHRASLGLRRTGGNIVWGLMRDGELLVPHPERGPILLDIVDRIIAEQVTVRAAASELTHRGIPTARGAAAWSHQALLKVLRSPALAGMVEAHGKLLHRDDGFPWVHDGALLSVNRWNALQAALDERARTRQSTERTSALHVLHGLVEDVEGHRLYRRIASAASQQAPRFACPQPHCRAFASVSVPALEGFVLDAFRDVVGGQRETEAKVVLPGRDTDRLQRIRADIARTTAALATARDGATIQELAARLELQRQAEASAEEGGTHGDVFAFEETGRTWAEAFDACTDDAARRELLSKHIERVVVRRHERRGPRAPLASRVEVVWLAD